MKSQRLSPLASHLRCEERLLADSNVRPARTLVRAFAQRADRRPEAALGLGQVGVADLVAAQVVIAPADEVRPVAVFDVMAIGLDGLRWRRLPIVAGNGAIDLAQELRGVEGMERARAPVEQPGQRLVVVAELRLDVITRTRWQQQRHVGMADGRQHELVGRHVHQEQAIEIDPVVGELEVRLVIAGSAHDRVQPTQSLHLHPAGHRVIRERPARAANRALR